MGFQNQVNSTIGLAAGLRVGKSMSTGIKDVNTSLQNFGSQVDTLSAQYAELKKPDYGKTLTNAIAEQKAIQSLYDAQYGGRHRKWKQSTEGIIGEELTSKALSTSNQRLQDALDDYNHPAGKEFTHRLSIDPEENE